MGFYTKKNAPAPQSLPAAEITCTVFGLSETGPSRSSNEDKIIFFHPGGSDTVFAMVADGMGGHNAGEIASDIACSSVKDHILKNYTNSTTTALLTQAMHEANKAIWSAATNNSDYSGMGTTGTVALVANNNLHYAQVGDSRLYHFRNGVLTQCTTDQTLINKMMQEGAITAAEAVHHPMKHILTQALGTTRELLPVVSEEGIPVVSGDRFFMCSDGIYDILRPAEIQALMGIPRPDFLLECIKALCSLRVASDNFSVIIIDIIDKQTPGGFSPAIVPITKEQNVPL